MKHWKSYLSPRFITNKVREKGIVWCTHAAGQIVQSSLDMCTRPIRAKLWSVHDNIRYSEKKQPDVLYAFYDLAVSPATFDIVKFLLLAELDRKEIGCSSIHVIIVLGPAEGFRIGDLESYHRTGARDHDTEYMHWRLKNVVVPCCWLIHSCQQVTVCTSREEAQALKASLVKHLFPTGYTVSFPKENYDLRHIVDATSQGVILPSIQVMPQARRFVTDWFHTRANGRKVVTITLRESSYELARNSNLKAWSTFARNLDLAIYFPVIIRDTEVALKPLPSELDGLTVFAEASWNIQLLAALYELSYLNMGVNGGTLALCGYNRRARCLRFKMITSVGATSKEFFRSQGLEPGSQLMSATPFQRLVWDVDRLEVIQKEFKEMCDRIEKISAETIETP